VSVDGKVYDVVVAPGGSIENIQTSTNAPISVSSTGGEPLNAPLAGNIFKVLVNEGDDVEEGEVVIIMEAMKMETEIRATKAGEVSVVHTREGDSVAVGDTLLSLV
jgi:oxaloacetate decarboxylase alpha subunit